MSAVFALEIFFEQLKAAIEETFLDGDTKRVIVEWGNTRVPCELNYGTVGRVLVVPGLEDGTIGGLEGPEQLRQPAMCLDTLAESFRVYCYGHDPTAQNSDDRAHDHVAMLVRHETIRQIRKIGFVIVSNYSDRWDRNMSGMVELGTVRQLKPLAQHLLGREYLIPAIIKQPILDMFDGGLPSVNVAPAVANVADTLGDLPTENSTTAEES
jgi:hypothetical protein